MNSELTYPIFLAARPRVKNRSIILQVLFSILLVGITLPVVLVLGLLGIFESAHLVLPGVSISSMEFGSESLAKAQEQLNVTWNNNTTFTLSDGKHTWTAAPIDYGLYLDPARTAADAYAAGRGSYVEELLQILSRKSRLVQPVVVFNPAMAHTRLEQIAKEINIDARDAELQYAGGQWTSTIGQPGQALDIEAAVAQIKADPLLAMMHGQVQLRVAPLVPQVSDLSQLAKSYQALVNKPLKLRAYDPISDETFTWSIPSEQLAPYLKVENPLSETPTVTLDGRVLDEALAKWQKDTLGEGRVFEEVQGRDRLSETWQKGAELFALIRRLPTSYTVQSGDTFFTIATKVSIPYWRIEKANPGIQPGGLTAGQKLVIPSKNDLLPLPVVLNKRILISLSEQHMWTYENGKLRSEHVISSGMSNSPTMVGVFQVTEHILNAYGERWDLWMPHWLTIYEAVPGFTNGIHGLPLLHNGVRLWGNVLGQPASYGCIIMTLSEAEDLYNWAQNGTVVEIKP